MTLLNDPDVRQRGLRRVLGGLSAPSQQLALHQPRRLLT